MNRLAIVSISTLALGGLCLAQTSQNKAAIPDRADSYYDYAMGHLYSELAGVYGARGGDYLTKAIEHYKAALKEDPSAGYIFEELTDLYVQFGRLRDAVSEAEDLLQRNPDNLDARRLLGRIYTRMIGEPQQGKIDEKMLARAIDQYQKVTAKDPKDIESWLILGRLYRASSDSVKAEQAYGAALKVDPDNTEALTGLALVYSDVGDTAKAIEKLKAATDHNADPRALSILANAYEQEHDYRSAADALKRALDAQPDNPRIMRALAQDLLLSERYDEALKYYKDLANDDPKDSQLQLRMSEIYREKHDFASAREALEKAKALDPDSLEVRYDEVNLLEAQGKTGQAIAGLKTIIQETEKKSYSASERGNRAMLLERLGMLYRSSSQTAPAVEAFRQIAALDPDGAARASVQIVDTYRLAKDYKAALEESDAALQKYPKERMVKVVHASLLSDMGKIDQAAAELRAMLDGSHDRDTQLALAQIYEKGKRFDDMAKALDAAEQLSKNDKDRANVHFMRGAMYERTKQYDAAEAEFRKVLAVDPENASALNYLGYMFADRAVRLDEAEKLIQRALELDPGNGAYLDSLGWVFYHQNRLPEAENMLLSALEKIGKDPTVHDHLGDVYFKEGKTKEAITQWEASLKEYDGNSDSDMDSTELAKISKKLEGAKVRLAKETSGKN